MIMSYSCVDYRRNFRAIDLHTYRAVIAHDIYVRVVFYTHLRPHCVLPYENISRIW